MLWDQIQKFKEFGSLVFCIGFSIISLFWSSNSFVGAVVKANKLTNSFSSSIDSFGSFFKNFYNSIKTNETLRKEKESYIKLIEQYKELPHDMEMLKKENEELRKELGFKYKSKYSTIKAEVLSVRLNTIYRTVVIGKGSKDGIKPYMPVIARSVSEDGEVLPALVGKVIAVEESSSIIQPIINSNFNMGVQIPGINFWAVLTGNSGKGTLALLNYVDSGIIINPLYNSINKIAPSSFDYEKGLQLVGVIGKTVFSSGGGGMFPANLPVGVVIEEGPREGSFKTAYIKPLVNFEELEYVTIIKKLPAKWEESWPEDKEVKIDNPLYGELDFPGEEPEKEKPEEPIKPPEKKEVKKTTAKPAEKEAKPKKETTPAKKTNDGNKSILDMDEDFLLKKLEEGGN